MPDVRLPDGTIVRNVPAGTTRSQLMARVGKSQAAKPSARQALGATGLDQINEFLIGVPQGLYNMAATVTDPIAGLFVGDKAVQQARTQRQDVVDAAQRALVNRPTPVARMAGQVASTLPLSGVRAAGMFGRAAPVVTRAMQGALGGAAVRETDTSGLNEAGIGAAANVVLPPAIAAIATSRPVRSIGRGIRDLAAPIINPLVNAGYAKPALGLPHTPAPQMPHTPAPQMPHTPAPQMPLLQSRAPVPSPMPVDLGREAAVRAARFRSIGVDQPTTGMVTRDPRAWNFEQRTAKLSGLGDELLSQFQDVEKKIADAGAELVRSQGGAKGAEATGLGVQKALDAKRGEMQRITSRLYEKVRKEQGDAAAGSLNSLREAMDSPDVMDNPVFDQMREGIQRRLQRFGMAGQSGMVRNNAVATISQAEELRKLIGGLGPSNDPSVRYMRGRLIDALDDDVVSSVGDDAFKAARASARARFNEFSKTFSGRIADEGVPPEKLTQRLFGATSLADLRSLKKSLLSGTDEQIARGTEAMQGLRAQAVDDLIGGFVSPDGKVNGTALFKKFEKDADKLREILDPADYKTLRRIAMAARDATADVPFSAVNYSNTATDLFEKMNPPTQNGVLGLLAKHGGAYMAAGPAGNVALAVGDQALKQRAAQKSADVLMRQIQMARDPQEYAMALGEANAAAQSRADVAALLQRWQDFTGNSPVIGGLAAGAAQQ